MRDGMVALHAHHLETFGEPSRVRVALFDDVTPAPGLLDEFVVHRVDSAVALELLATQTPLDAIVAGWRAGLPELAARLKLRLIVVAPMLPELLVDSVARGIDARWVANIAGAVAELHLLRATRPADGVRHRVGEVEVRIGGARAELRDLSNDGLAFEIADADVEALLPGRELDGLELVRHGRVCLAGVRALVRHIEPLAPGRYLVGCALKPRAASATAPATIIRDRALCAALVRSGLGAGVVLTPLDADARDGAAEIELVGGRIDVARGTLFAACERTLQTHDLVRGQFEVAGRLYRFTTVILSAAPLELKLPPVIEETQQRASARHRLRDGEALVVDVRSPLGDGAARKSIVDLSSSGFSFAVDGARDLYPLGLRLDVTMQLPDGALACAAEVRTLRRDGDGLRCGVELVGADAAERLRLANYVMRLRFPGIDDGAGTGVDELFDFFRATGFLYPAKEAVLAPVLDEVRHAFTALYAQPSPLFKAVVARDEAGALSGHVSGIRAYRHTWMSHHLAAQPTKHVAHLLNLGAAEYFGQNPDLEFFKIYFHADNKWPARVFGGFARMLRDSSQSELRSFRHLTVPSDALLQPAPRDVDVMEASGDELAVVERYFVERERSLLLRADDLTRDALQLSEVNKRFGTLGLYRRRRVLVAMRKNVCLGFALAELSSPGMNLSEGLSMFRTFVTPAGEPVGPAVRLALLHAMQPIYRAAGRGFMRGLMDPAEADDYARIGVPAEETSLAWTCHRALYPRFCDHVDRLFEILRRRKRA